MTARSVITERLVDVARAAAAAGWGQKGPIYEAAAAELGMSVQTLHKRLHEVGVRPARRQRSDSGQMSLTYDEAMQISAYLTESARRNGKRLADVATAVDVLRRNGLIQAGRVDTQTGEFAPLSTEAVRRALHSYGVHPDQLSRPSPKVSLASLHPNHVWQIDPSLCVLYYLRGASGLRAMPHDEFYKNKPKNLDKVSQDRVWRYVITDHTSGTIFVEYVLGAESGMNLVHCFVNAMQKRGPQDPFHGAPLMVMLDPGSANTGAVFKNLCIALGIEIQINLPGRPWAKGQVENGNNIVECKFEHGLKFINVNTLDELNAAAGRWMRNFNGTAIHSRTSRTRYGAWLTITSEQLRIPPSAEVCKELAVMAPMERTVTAQLEINYRGNQFDVSSVPGVQVGCKLKVTRNPWRDAESAQIMLVDDDGRQVFHFVDIVKKTEFGFRESAAILGHSYTRHADTPADKARAKVEQILMGTDNVEEAEAKRKAKALPFNGMVDPYKPITDTVLPAYMPRRGTDLNVSGPVIEVPPMGHFAAAKRLKPLLGDLWTTDSYAWVTSNYPDGVREDELDQIASRLKQLGGSPQGLRVIGGE